MNPLNSKNHLDFTNPSPSSFDVWIEGAKKAPLPAPPENLNHQCLQAIHEYKAQQHTAGNFKTILNTPSIEANSIWSRFELILQSFFPRPVGLMLTVILLLVGIGIWFNGRQTSFSKPTLSPIQVSQSTPSTLPHILTKEQISDSLSTNENVPPQVSQTPQFINSQETLTHTTSKSPEKTILSHLSQNPHPPTTDTSHYTHPSPVTKKVQFRIHLPSAETVHLVGDFNQWDKDQLQLKKIEAGIWEISLDLSGGSYQYQFLINGKIWQADPNNTSLVEDGFGGINSSITL